MKKASQSNITEKKMDLFDVEDSYALCHCVGADFAMGAGIAVKFKQLYGSRAYLIEHSRGVGTCILLCPKGRPSGVFYLVTKPISARCKPTYESIESSIIDMFRQAKENNITKIAMPRIGCGLDRLRWERVKKILEDYQQGTGIKLLVCTL